MAGDVIRQARDARDGNLPGVERPPALGMRLLRVWRRHGLKPAEKRWMNLGSTPISRRGGEGEL
jgi:hypothetical protein